MRLKKTLLFCLYVSITGISIYAQSYTISGTVTDARNSDVLPGASVIVKGTTNGTVSDLNGNFKLTVPSNKPVIIEFSYISYKNNTYTTDGKSIQGIQIALTPGSTTLQEVEVTGKAQGQVKALTDQRLAENIKNIVSYEQIEQFPDMNAAEVLQRIAGITLQRDQGEGRFVQLRGTPPELTNFSINGEQIPSPEGGVRYVGLDVIAADQIDFIEVSKVLTPDMDGDAIGGSVNIITKTGQNEVPSVKVTVANGYNNLRESFFNPILQLDYGQKFSRLGVSLNASYQQNNQGAENLESKYLKSTFWGNQSDGIENYHLQYREFQLRHYTIQRERTGLSLSLDYMFNKNNMVYLKSMYNRYSDDETRRRVIYDLDDAASYTYYLYGGISRDIKDRIKNQQIAAFNLGGENMFNKLEIDYELSYSLAAENQPNRVEAEFSNPGQAIQMRFDFSNPDWPEVILPHDQDINNANNYAGYDFDEIQFVNSQIYDINYTAKINFHVPFSFAGTDNTIKFGGKVRAKNKNRDQAEKLIGNYSSIYNPEADPPRIYPDEELILTSVSDEFYTDLFNRGYEISNIPNHEKLSSFYQRNKSFFYGSKDSIYDDLGTDYNATEVLYAGYAMLKLNVNKLMVLAGLRYERNIIHYNGKKILTDDDGDPLEAVDTASSRIQDFLLPNVQLKYTVNPLTNIRAACTYSYARPNFDDVLPYQRRDRDEIEFGNSDLKYPVSLNLDLLAETYLTHGGVISGGLFYKKIDNFIFYYKRYGPTSEPGKGGSLSRVSVARNGEDASVYGLEIQSQSKFSLLPKPLNSFGLFMNYTYTYSEALIKQRIPGNHVTEVISFGADNAFEIPGKYEKITLPGQAKHSANLALFFDNDKFYAKITANYHDNFLDDLGADKDLDEYYTAAWHFDFNANYNINSTLKIFADAVNLSNAPLKYFLGSPDYVLKQEYYSWTGRLGVKLNF